jgi:hypothetical protein
MFSVIDYSQDPVTPVDNTASTHPTTVETLEIRLGPRPYEPTPIGYEIPEDSRKGTDFEFSRWEDRGDSIYTVFDPKHSIRSEDGQWACDLSRPTLTISLEGDSLKSIGYYPNLERADMWESFNYSLGILPQSLDNLLANQVVIQRDIYDLIAEIAETFVQFDVGEQEYPTSTLNDERMRLILERLTEALTGIKDGTVVLSNDPMPAEWVKATFVDRRELERQKALRYMALAIRNATADWRMSTHKRYGPGMYVARLIPALFAYAAFRNARDRTNAVAVLAQAEDSAEDQAEDQSTPQAEAREKPRQLKFVHWQPKNSQKN